MATNQQAGLYDQLFSTPEMREVFSDPHYLARMTEFELALLAALESQSLIPAGLAQRARSASARLQFDMDQLAAECSQTGNIAIPFLRELTRQISVLDLEAANYLHWGATSQDTQDTATVLQLRAGLDLLLADLDKLLASCAQLASSFATAIMPGRTWLQQGPPVTFGLKMAGYLDCFLRHRVRLLWVRENSCVLSLGGAVGTQAAYGQQGAAVATAAAAALHLQSPTVTWHTHRDRLAETATTLGLLAGTLGKLGRDLSLLMQTEVAEAAEGHVPGRGGSSTMPHKRNPVSSSVMLAAAARLPGLVATMLTAMVQEHERGLGGWQAEWETLPQIFRLTAGSLRHASTALRSLTVLPPTMLHNMGITRGLAMTEALSLALAGKVGKPRAHAILEQASASAFQDQRNLLDVLQTIPEVTAHFAPDQLAQLLDASHYLGSTQQQIEAVLAIYKESPHAGV